MKRTATTARPHARTGSSSASSLHAKTISVDGARVFHVVAAPSGLAKDGASTVYRRLPITAGRHRITARLSDTADGAFNHTHDATLDLVPGRVVVIDFDSAQGGFVIRS